MKLNLQHIAFTVTVLVGMCSCTKLLEVDNEKNVILDVNPETLLPAALKSTADVVGGRDAMIIGGFWAQYWTQGPNNTQYADIDRFEVTPSTFSSSYASLFVNSLLNYNKIIDRCQVDSLWQLNLMATTMRVYCYQLLVDLYDKVPYSDALQRDEKPHPNWEDGKFVYNNIYAELETALEMVEIESPKVDSKYDLLFDGDIESWKEFANTLKLRILLRQRYTSDSTSVKAELIDVIGSATMLTKDAVLDIYYDETGKRNPLYESQDNHDYNSKIRGSKSLLKWIKNTFDDSRTLEIFGNYYHRFSSYRTYQFGVVQGYYDSPYSKWVQSYPRLNASDPIFYISLTESYLLQAEANLWLNQLSDAESNYTLGVKASFEMYDLGASGDTMVGPGRVYEFPATNGEGAQDSAIAIQKWMALANISHLESFIEINRTGYPKLSDCDALENASTGCEAGYLTNPVYSALGKNVRPRRLLVPDNEINRNDNAPNQDDINKTLTTPVWWDTKE